MSHRDNVTAIEKYRALANLEHVAGIIIAAAVRSKDDVRMTQANTLREAVGRVHDAINEESRLRLTEQLEQSIELIGKSPERMRRDPDDRLGAVRDLDNIVGPI